MVESESIFDTNMVAEIPEPPRRACFTLKLSHLREILQAVWQWPKGVTVSDAVAHGTDEEITVYLTGDGLPDRCVPREDGRPPLCQVYVHEGAPEKKWEVVVYGLPLVDDCKAVEQGNEQ